VREGSGIFDGEFGSPGSSRFIDRLPDQGTGRVRDFPRRRSDMPQNDAGLPNDVACKFEGCGAGGERPIESLQLQSFVRAADLFESCFGKPDVGDELTRLEGGDPLGVRLGCLEEKFQGAYGVFIDGNKLVIPGINQGR